MLSSFVYSCFICVGSLVLCGVRLRFLLRCICLLLFMNNGFFDLGFFGFLCLSLDNSFAAEHRILDSILFHFVRELFR